MLHRFLQYFVAVGFAQGRHLAYKKYNYSIKKQTPGFLAEIFVESGQELANYRNVAS